MIVRSAEVRGMKEEAGRRLAEVEVETDDARAANVLAYFREGPKGYQLVRVLTNDADRETDWFDNDMHQAFADVTVQLFGDASHLGEHDIRAFAGQILAFDTVRAAFEREFERR